MNELLCVTIFACVACLQINYKSLCVCTSVCVVQVWKMNLTVNSLSLSLILSAHLCRVEAERCEMEWRFELITSWREERDEVVSLNCNSCKRAIERDVKKERKRKERKQPDLTLYTQVTNETMKQFIFIHSLRCLHSFDLSWIDFFYSISIHCRVEEAKLNSRGERGRRDERRREEVQEDVERENTNSLEDNLFSTESTGDELHSIYYFVLKWVYATCSPGIGSVIKLRWITWIGKKKGTKKEKPLDDSLTLYNGLQEPSKRLFLFDAHFLNHYSHPAQCTRGVCSPLSPEKVSSPFTAEWGEESLITRLSFCPFAYSCCPLYISNRG